MATAQRMPAWQLLLSRAPASLSAEFGSTPTSLSPNPLWQECCHSQQPQLPAELPSAMNRSQSTSGVDTTVGGT